MVIDNHQIILELFPCKCWPLKWPTKVSWWWSMPILQSWSLEIAILVWLVSSYKCKLHDIIIGWGWKKLSSRKSLNWVSTECKILSTPHRTVMNLNNVMNLMNMFWTIYYNDWIPSPLEKNCLKVVACLADWLGDSEKYIETFCEEFQFHG